METKFYLNENNPSKILNFGWGNKYQQSSLYPKYWVGETLVTNPFYYGLYLPFFDIERKEIEAKWGKIYFWSISKNGVEVLSRNAGHSVTKGVRYTQHFFDINDGVTPDVDIAVQYEFSTDLVGDGFSTKEINSLRSALGLPELKEEDFNFEW